MIRYIIYWAKTLKIDTAHELELKAELLDNNILVLKEKLKNTNDPKEKARLEDIIRKQSHRRITVMILPLCNCSLSIQHLW